MVGGVAERGGHWGQIDGPGGSLEGSAGSREP